jgi:hypothetical protein
MLEEVAHRQAGGYMVEKEPEGVCKQVLGVLEGLLAWMPSILPKRRSVAVLSALELPFVLPAMWHMLLLFPLLAWQMFPLLPPELRRLLLLVVCLLLLALWLI